MLFEKGMADIKVGERFQLWAGNLFTFSGAWVQQACSNVPRVVARSKAHAHHLSMPSIP